MTPQQPTTTEAGKRLLDDCIETAWPRDVDVRVMLDDARYADEGYEHIGGAPLGTKWSAICLAFVTAPGKIGRSVRCEHKHRSHREAKECGQRLAEAQR